MNWIVENWTGIMAAVGLVVTAASAIVKLTPSQKDDAIMAKVLKVLDYVSIFNPKPPKA